MRLRSGKGRDNFFEDLELAVISYLCCKFSVELKIHCDIIGSCRKPTEIIIYVLNSSQLLRIQNIDIFYLYLSMEIIVCVEPSIIILFFS